MMKKINSKTKKLPLNSINLMSHSQLHALTKHDKLKLRAGGNIDMLDIGVMQAILDIHPLPVTQNSENNYYLALMPSGFLERFKAHPLSAKLTVSLLVYPQEAAARLLTIGLLYSPAFSMSLALSGNTIQERLLCFKKHSLPCPTKKVLANLANALPSTFR